MKQSIKYGLLLVLSLLIYSVVNQTMENKRKEISPVYRQEKCLVSTNDPAQNALAHFLHSFFTQSCDMSHKDMVYVPADKSIPLHTNFSRQHKSFRNIPDYSSYHIPKFLSDPITYYIYGLRKIII